MDQDQDRFLDAQSPYTLFLILILLILGTEKDLENYLENARNFILETKRSIESFRVGYETMETNLKSFHAQLMNLHK